MIDNLFVFDFDDTLAETVALIGVARLVDGKNDELFRGWMIENNLFPMNEKTTKKGIKYFYLSSDDYATYQKAASDVISERIIDYFDFSGTASVSSDKATPHENIVNILKQAEANSKNRVIVVTARSGGELPGPFGTTTATNRQDIADFLNGVGSNINSSQVFPVGSSNPNAKVSVVRKYIDALSPAVVYFYDDNDLNLDAIHQLCDEMRGSPNIVTYKISDGMPAVGREC